MILYRPVGLQELELIYDSGMKAFPARLPQQPVFYPVVQPDYARKIALDWNARNGQFAGYITEFRVDDDYIGQFERHPIGGSDYEEFWIPAEEMEEFNSHIVGHIKVREAHFGETFEGFIPDKFGLQGKNAVEQFTFLANTFVYKRMDFYLEIKRNHKAVFLNYPFWQQYDFRNPGLKEKVIQAIKEAWLTSFPKTPLPPPPAPEEAPPVEQAASYPLQDPAAEEDEPDEQSQIHPPLRPVREDLASAKTRAPRSFVEPARESVAPAEETASSIRSDSIHEDDTPEEQPDPHSPAEADEEDLGPGEEIHSPVPVRPVPEGTPFRGQSGSHFVEGVKLGLSGDGREAVRELSRAVAEDPEHVAARTSLGVAFHRVEEDDRALACYTAALKIDPTYAEAHYFRANILYRRGLVQEAIAGYTRAIGLQPTLIDAHLRPAPPDRLTDYSPAPAEVYRIARSAHRILALNKALEASPRQAGLFKERAAEYSRLWNYDQAVADYSASLRLQPGEAGTLHARGAAYEALGLHDRAREDYRQAAAIDPSLSASFIDRGVALANMGNYRQAIVSLTDGIRLAPRNPDGYFNRGTAYLQEGDLERAIEDFSSVLRLSAGDTEAYYWRAICNEQAGRTEPAIADYRQFLALSQDPRARAEVEQRLSQWEKANQSSAPGRSAAREAKQETRAADAEKPDRAPDLYDLIAALGDRALKSTWLGSEVECYGEGAEELSSFTDQDQPIEGRDLLRIASGIYKTTQGDFIAFDPGATSHWIFIRAWEGSGFYIETNVPHIKAHLRTRFRSVEDVEGAAHPYEGFFIRI